MVCNRQQPAEPRAQNQRGRRRGVEGGSVSGSGGRASTKAGVRGRGKGGKQEHRRREIDNGIDTSTGAESTCTSATHHSMQPLVVGSAANPANAPNRRQSRADIHGVADLDAAVASVGHGEHSDTGDGSRNGAEGHTSHGIVPDTQSMLRVGAFDEEEAQPDHSPAQLNKVVRLLTPCVIVLANFNLRSSGELAYARIISLERGIRLAHDVVCFLVECLYRYLPPSRC